MFTTHFRSIRIGAILMAFITLQFAQHAIAAPSSGDLATIDKAITEALVERARIERKGTSLVEIDQQIRALKIKRDTAQHDATLRALDDKPSTDSREAQRPLGYGHHLAAEWRAESMAKVRIELARRLLSILASDD